MSDSPIEAARIPGHQLVDRRVLHQVAAGAGEDRVEHVRVLVRDRQDDDARQRRDRADLARRLDAAHPRHVEIHDDDVRRQLADLRDGLRAVPGLADDLDALLLEEIAEPGPEEIVIVDEQHPQGPFFDALGCLERLAHLPPLGLPATEDEFSARVTVTTRRPQASAC